MADPHHIPEMDAFDRRTVILYRAGLVVAAVGLAGAAALQWVAPDAAGWGWLGIFAGVALSAGNLHLYDKTIRWSIGGAGWLGAWLLLGAGQLDGAAAHGVGLAGLGFLFVVLSGLALKEQFCFRVPFLRLLPILLAGSLIPLLLGRSTEAGMMLAACAALQTLLAGAKLRMPLHYDIGDKSKYQI